MHRSRHPVLDLFVGLLAALAVQRAVAFQEFSAALDRALHDPAAPFALEVDCTGDSGRRALRLYPSATLIWNGRRQATVDAATRHSLLETLREHGFAAFEAQYGGKPGAPASGAPIKVLCRIAATVDGVAKSSYQDVNGERSAEFMTLAGKLLDRAQPLGEAGVGADTLAQGLAMLAAGELAPEVLRLQVMRIPGDAVEPGFIIEIRDGALRRKSYRPGVESGAWTTRPMESGDLPALIAALQQADIESMPRSLAAPDTCRLDLWLLQHSQTVQARARQNVAAADGGADADRLLRLAGALNELF